MNSVKDYLPRLGHPIWKLLALAALVVLLFSTLAPVVIRHMPFSHIDKVYHFLSFLVLAFLLMNAFTSWNRWLIFAGLSILGLLIEAAQFYIPGRSFSWFDWLADTMGALIIALFFYRRKKTAVQDCGVEN